MDEKNKTLVECWRTFSDALARKSIFEPTKVQTAVADEILDGKDIFFQSETGTGKTLAYIIPLLCRYCKELEGKSPAILAVAPTIELASQIKRVFDWIIDGKSYSTALCVGASNIQRQIEGLKKKPTIIVGTASRLCELEYLRKLRLKDVKVAIFDEFDRLVAKESAEITSDLLGRLADDVQIIGCSATLGKTSAFESRFPKKKFAKIVLENEGVLSKHIEHIAILSEDRDKISSLRSLLHILSGKKTLIFASTPFQVENIAAKLRYHNINCVALYSKMKKMERKSAFDAIVSGKSRVMVTSDLAARGLDIPDVNCIIQTDLCDDEKTFIHRAGRTARYGKSGENYVIGNAGEMQTLARLEKRLHIVVTPKELWGGKLQKYD